METERTNGAGDSSGKASAIAGIGLAATTLALCVGGFVWAMNRKRKPVASGWLDGASC